jgi:hypothetical protein
MRAPGSPQIKKKIETTQNKIPIPVNPATIAPIIMEMISKIIIHLPVDILLFNFYDVKFFTLLLMTVEVYHCPY